MQQPTIEQAITNLQGVMDIGVKRGIFENAESVVACQLSLETIKQALAPQPEGIIKPIVEKKDLKYETAN